MDKKHPITSTEEFAQTVLSARTPQMEPIIFTQSDFLTAMKKVSRKQEEPPPEHGEEPKKE
jgi:hypothetical protein